MEQDFNKEYLELLAHKYKAGSLTDEEAAYFEAWYSSFDDERLELPVAFGPNPVAVRERMHRKLRSRIKAAEKKHRHRKFLPLAWQRSVAAAIILLVAGLSVYRYYFRPQKKSQLPDTATALNVTPGSDKAILMLSSGKAVQLVSVANGMIMSEPQADIKKTSDGQIVYNTVGNNLDTTAFNTLATPRGGQFRVTLPDGTKVWLNAASSLRYPVAFPAKGNRLVQLNGEAYFEVAKDKSRPFIVKTSGQQVEVLGTHFNINSYEDEGQTRTTLEEGSVKVSSSVAGKVIVPGEQTALDKNGNLTVTKAELETALAWKNGQMEFKDANIHEIMRQVSRWYDIDVKFRGNVGQRRFNGTVSRSSNLSALLRILEFSDVHFELSGDKRKTLTVIP